ncbi:MAG: hypothetical protein ACXVDD_10225, partial [Polyangia bacterium]
MMLLLIPAAARAGSLAVSPSSLSFDGGGDRTLTVRNAGDATVRIDRVAVAPGSTGFQVAPALGRVLQPGESYELQVTFTPDGKRAQAFGAVQIQTPDELVGVALRAGASWLLTLMIFFPLVGAALVLAVPRGRDGLVRAIALATSLVPLAAAGFLVAHFD